MKTVFDQAIRDELIDRINLLHESSVAEWGKMNVYQMLKHCTICEEMYLGRKEYKRVFLGRLFGKIGLRNILKDETPMQRNAPTGQGFKVQEANGDVSKEKIKWISLIEEYEHYSNNNFVHWFFGNMTKEQVGLFVYKHDDHHLRQFGV